MANELPTLETLQGTYGAWNPEAYTQARENQGLAQQFQQQNLAQESNTTQEGFLKNQQSAAMNPMLLTQQGNMNTKGLQDNQSSALDLERKNALQFQNLALDQQKAIYNMKDEDLKAIDQHGEELLRSNNPTERAQGQQIIAMGKEFRTAKQKQDYAMELERLQGANQLRNTGAQGSNQRQIEQMGIDAGKYARRGGAGGGGISFTQKLPSMKVPEQVSATYAILQSGISPDTREPLTDIERTFFQSLYDQGARTLEAKTASQGVGPTLQVQPSGSMQMINKTAPSVRPTTTPQENSTKSGVKFRVVPQ